MKKALCWIRRDLRLHDHRALSEALKSAESVYIAFIFDSLILDDLTNRHDQRVSFIMDSLKEIEEILRKKGSSLIVRYGDPRNEIPKIISEFNIDGLFFNRDYEPYAKKRDKEVEKILSNKNILVSNYKDHVFYEKHEIRNGSGEIYKVFTPYKNKWLETFQANESLVPDYKINLKNLAQFENSKNVLIHDWFTDIGMMPSDTFFQGGTSKALSLLKDFRDDIDNYKEGRDIPSLEGTSKLSTYIRMGNLSLRDMIRVSLESSNVGHATWLSELIWRDFYHMILDAHPEVEDHCFRIEYDKIKWIGSTEHFQKWCDGETGFPIVDAAMRCLNATGFMHNRLRMVVASFLTKTLLIDWRKGERYFAAKLLDYDLAANNGGWQWSASTGVDAQPYFRIFNPFNQSEKFDPDAIFIRQWCPELNNFSNKSIHAPHDTEIGEQILAKCFIGKDYPGPIVSYKANRQEALEMYKKVKD
ncbi:MAG: DNA photolyase family protein [Bdellovibrionales bacterium]|nr:DNA photolyase family protein [Bdellovibrionales bacterium]